jgi:hypothetical protein
MTPKPKKHKQKYEYVGNTAFSKKGLLSMINSYTAIGWELVDIMNVSLGVYLTFRRKYEKTQTTI